MVITNKTYYSIVSSNYDNKTLDELPQFIGILGSNVET